MYLCQAMDIRKTIAKIIATGFGFGYWPWGPGTAGALAATLIWIVLGYFFPPSILMIVTTLLVFFFTLIGIWATKLLMPEWGNDPSRVVVDEMVGIWIPLIIAPPKVWWQAAIAFLLFRFFDILKPLGIKSLDRRVGAFWVIADDLLAGVYSFVILMLVKWVV